jgi:hypothetical protein
VRRGRDPLEHVDGELGGSEVDGAHGRAQVLRTAA